MMVVQDKNAYGHYAFLLLLSLFVRTAFGSRQSQGNCTSKSPVALIQVAIAQKTHLFESSTLWQKPSPVVVERNKTKGKHAKFPTQKASHEKEEAVRPHGHVNHTGSVERQNEHAGKHWQDKNQIGAPVQERRSGGKLEPRAGKPDKQQVHDLVVHEQIHLVVNGDLHVANDQTAELVAPTKLAGTGTSNLAIGSVVTCEDGIYCEAAGLVDGKTATSSWKHAPHANISGGCDMTKWVQVDMQKLCLISRVVLVYPHDDCRHYCSIKLAVSTDGQTWENLYNNFGEYSGRSTRQGLALDFAGKRARYVRWYSGPSDVADSVEFLELKVFGRRLPGPAMTTLPPATSTIATTTFTYQRPPQPPWRAGTGPDMSPAPEDLPPPYSPEVKSILR